MGSLVVVVEHPPSGRLADIVQASWQVRVRDFFAKGPTRAFNVDVRVGLAGLACDASS
ncbi:MAG: hypothetical protein MUE84_17735 [Hyphomonas sp.]|nr:hypothetical protein [Hyphomonas sp.]